MVKRSPAATAATTSSLLLLLLLFLISPSPSSALAGTDASSNDGHTISGRVKLEGTSKGAILSAKGPATKVILNGGQKVTFVRTDGYFSFCNVSAGTHLIEVAALGYFFSPVRIDISARNPGKIQAALTETRRPLHELVLEPLRQEHYYEVKEPFSIMSLVKSPMGLMIGFMLLVMFVFPKMIDPEELKKAQEELRGQGAQSNLLQRAS